MITSSPLRTRRFRVFVGPQIAEEPSIELLQLWQGVLYLSEIQLQPWWSLLCNSQHVLLFLFKQCQSLYTIMCNTLTKQKDYCKYFTNYGRWKMFLCKKDALTSLITFFTPAGVSTCSQSLKDSYHLYLNILKVVEKLIIRLYNSKHLANSL